MLELKLTQLEGCTPNLEPVRKQERQILRIFSGPDQIKTFLIRIRILLFTLIRIQIMLFNLIRIQLFDRDLDPYRFKEVMYLKQYFLYIFT
jgi:hypothetical protein